MKNIDRFTSTKDALEAYKKLDFKKVPFDIWLECEYEDPREKTLLEAAEAVTDEWYDMQQNINCNDIGEIIVDLEKAIAREKRKPVRNCDKYRTAEEAYIAFSNVCQKEEGCLNCRFKNTEYGECSILWAYEEAKKEVSK